MLFEEIKSFVVYLQVFLFLNSVQKKSKTEIAFVFMKLFCSSECNLGIVRSGHLHCPLLSANGITKLPSGF